jgi:fatty acid desaturase
MSPREEPPAWFTVLFITAGMLAILALILAVAGGPWWAPLMLALPLAGGMLIGAAFASVRRNRGGR